METLPTVWIGTRKGAERRVQRSVAGILETTLETVFCNQLFISEL